MILEADWKHILRTDKQYRTAVEQKEIWAFPHQSETIVVRRKYFLIFPLKTVRAGKQQDLTASVSRPVSNNAPVRSVGFLPQFRIAEILSAESLRQIPCIDHGIVLIFLVIHAIAHCDTLILPVDNRLVFLPLLDDAGIHQQLPAVRQCHCIS